jgi:hypothetical protein
MDLIKCSGCNSQWQIEFQESAFYKNDNDIFYKTCKGCHQKKHDKNMIVKEFQKDIIIKKMLESFKESMDEYELKLDIRQIEWVLRNRCD